MTRPNVRRNILIAAAGKLSIAVSDARRVSLERLYTIQYLRALAAFGVVYHHACERAGLSGWSGSAGVDVFFVISGFIMWTLARSKERSPAAFLGDRVIRIAPLYWFYTLLLTGLAVAIPSAFPRLKVDFSHLLASLFFIPARLPSPSSQIAPVLGQGWTLNYEMFFYAIFAANLLLPSKVRLFSMWLAIGALSTIGQFYQGDDPRILTYTDPISIEFAAGMLLGWLRDRRLLPSPAGGCVLFALGIALFWLTADWYRDSLRFLLWGTPALLLVAGALAMEPVAPRCQTLKVLGDASYSTYLSHTFVISAIGKIVEPMSSTYGFVAASLLLSAVTGYFSFVFLEGRLHQRAKRLLRDSKGAPATGLASPVKESGPPGSKTLATRE